MLMQMRSCTEAARALAYYASAQTDLATRADSADARQSFQRRVDLVIPIVKGWCTEIAQEVTYTGVQVHGGMGFIEETGAAQHMRDARILTIYEGTTGIQALDLMGRKMLRDQGGAMRDLIDEIRVDGAAFGAVPGLETLARRFEASLDALEGATRDYLQNAADDPDRGSAVGVDYLMLAGYVVGGWLLGRAALAANRHIDAGNQDAFYPGKIAAAVYFAERILPRSEALAASVCAGSASTLAISVDDL